MLFVTYNALASSNGDSRLYYIFVLTTCSLITEYGEICHWNGSKWVYKQKNAHYERKRQRKNAQMSSTFVPHDCLSHDMEVYVMTGMSMSWQRQSVHITLLFLQKWLPDESDNWKSIAVKGLRDPIEWPYKLTKTDESRFIGSSIIRIRLLKSRRQVKHESWPPTAHNEDRKMGEWWA